jgi:hypothetical protein
MKATEQILCEIWQCEPSELQLHITLNPDVSLIAKAMEIAANQIVEKAFSEGYDNGFTDCNNLK